MAEKLFSVLLERLIAEQNIQAERLREGLCTASMMARIRSGERLPNKMMRDRMIARLGVSGERNEHLLNPEDYAQWEKRRDIVKSVQRKETKRAEELLAEYTCEKDFSTPLGKQFYYAMEIQLMQYRNENTQEIAGQLEQALKLTVPYIDTKRVSELLLAPEEINLILEYEKCAHPQQLAWRCEELLEYISRSAMDQRTKATVYPKAVFYLWEARKREGEIDYAHLIRRLNSGIELLRDTQRTYYLWELLCAKEKALEQWIEKLQAEMNGKKGDALSGMLQETRKWKEMFKELCEKYAIPLFTENFCNLYLQQEIYCINEVIRRRRKMLGMTRKQLAEGICEEKALVRLENENRKTHMSIVRELLEKMNLSGEIWQTDIVTADRKSLELLESLVKYSNTFQVEKEKETLQQMEEYLDMDIPMNRQFIKKQQAIIQWAEDSTDRAKVLTMAQNALEYTINFEIIEKSDNLYLTNNEIQCLYNMGTYAGKDTISTYLNIVWNMCKKYEEYDEIEEHIGIYELITTSVADALGNMGLYGESDSLVAKTISWSLRCGRLYEVSRNLSSLSWNNLQRQKKRLPVEGHFNRKEDLERCLTISEFCKDIHHVNSLKKRLVELEKTTNA